jgi:DNA-binding MarR family transcriptional regulator
MMAAPERDGPETGQAPRGAGEPSPGTDGTGPGGEFSFLLVQLGFHVARQFAERLAPLGIEPRHFGVLTRIAAREGDSQQAIGSDIGLTPTRMVFVVDELEKFGLTERRRNPADRRSHALFLTAAGRDVLATARALAAQQDQRLRSALTADEQRELAALLRRLAAAWQIAPGSLPGLPPEPRQRG